jgi:hypothetical protein
MTTSAPAITAKTHDQFVVDAMTAISNAATTIEEGQKTIAQQKDVKVATDALTAAAKKIKEAEKAAQDAESTKITVSISVTAPTSLESNKKVNWGQNIFAAAILGVAVLLVVNEWLVRNRLILIHQNVSPVIAVGLLILVDAFLIRLLLVVAAYKGPSTKGQFPGIPDREAAVFLFIFLYFALVMLLGYMNLSWGLTKGMRDSLFEALLTVATLEHTHYVVGSSVWARCLVGGELLSVVLFIVVFFPLLIARLAVFKGELVTVEDVKMICRLRLGFVMSAEGPVKWSGGQVSIEGKEAHVKLDKDGNPIIEKTANT